MREYRVANLEKIRAGQRDHYARNSDKVKRDNKAYAKANPELTKARKAAQYDKTNPQRRAKIKEWQAKNPDKVKEIQRTTVLNRVARKRNAPGKHTIHDIRKLYDAQDGKCTVCFVSLLDGYHVDHVIPLSRGGDNWPTNLQLLCPTCNMQKSAQTMDEFLERRKRNVTT